MRPLRRPLAAIVTLAAVALCSSAMANGRGGMSSPSLYAPDWQHGAPAIAGRAAWRAGADLVAEAARYVGMGKFTVQPGPWCADAINVWLRQAGKPPLANRMASAALSYGPRGNGSPGDLAVFMGRRGAYHVGVVVASLGDRVEVISGNWSHRVGRATVMRNGLVFIKT